VPDVLLRLVERVRAEVERKGIDTALVASHRDVVEPRRLRVRQRVADHVVREDRFDPTVARWSCEGRHEGPSRRATARPGRLSRLRGHELVEDHATAVATRLRQVA